MELKELLQELQGEEPEYSTLANKLSTDFSELLEYYQHATTSVKCRLIFIVARLPGKEALQLLLSAGNGSDEALRISAVVAAGVGTVRSRAGKLKAFFEKCLHDESAAIRSAAVLSLHASHKKAFHDLLVALASDDESVMVRDAAAQVLAVKNRETAAELAASNSTSLETAREIRSDDPKGPVVRVAAIDTPLPGVELGI